MRCLRACALMLGALGGACLASGCGSSSPAAGTAAATVTMTAAAASGTPAGSSPSCPAAAAVSAAMGATYPSPQVVSAAGQAICTYNGASNSNGNDVTITISSGISASDLQSLAKNQGGVSGVSAVSGLGDGAYMDVGSSGISSELFVLRGTEGIEVSAFGSAAQLESVARAVLDG